MRILFFTIVLWLYRPAACGAQQNPYVFSHLKEKDGLSNNTVFSFLKDSRGIFWIGTQNGLNRFDGSNFYTYNKSKKKLNTIPDASIMSLCEDKKGNIWGGTNNGLFRFDPRTEKFTSWYPGDSKTGNSFLNICCDRNGEIWAGGWIVLLKFDTASNSFKEELRLSSPDSAVQYSMRQNCLLPDPSGNGFWMATRSGMFYYDVKEKKLLGAGNQPGNPLFSRASVGALASSASGHYWYFNNATREITSFDPSVRQQLSRISVKAFTPDAIGGTLYEDSKNRLWFSSWTSEALVVDYKQNKIVNISTQPNDPLSICNPFFWTVLEDKDATLWFGTINGISKCNPDKNIYSPYRLPETIAALKNTSITIVREDTFDHSLWLVTLDRKLINYNRQTGSYRIFDVTKSEKDRQGRIIGGIFFLVPGKDRLIAITDNGMWQMPKNGTGFSPFRFVQPGYDDFKTVNFVTAGDSIFYLSDYGKVLRLEMKTGKTALYCYPADKLADGLVPYVKAMVLDNKNKLWVYTGGGWVATIQDDMLQPVLVAKDEAGRSIGYFNSMIPDSQGNIWLTNEMTGLYRFNTTTREVNNWDESDGLNISAANSASADQYGQVWCVKANKVSVLLQQTNGVFNLAVPMGENATPYYNALEKLSNGNILSSIYNDLVEFKSQQVRLVPAKIRPQISLVNIAGRDHLLTDQPGMVLEPGENNVRFRFGIFTDKDVFPYDMEYMLDNAEKTWTRAAGNNEASYNNLAPGEYTFRVKAKGKNNGWESEEARFNIIIKAPFYKTSWFLVLIGLLLAGSLIFLYRYRLAQKEKLMMLESKAQRLEKEKVMTMYESLKQQLNPHFLFNSLTSLSGLIETDQQVAGDFLEQMSGIYRYILKNGDKETVSLKEETEFVQLYIHLQQTRFRKGLQVNIDVPGDYLYYKIAPVTLQNLIENAIKHNIIDATSPLVIDIFIDGSYLVVKNNLQKKNVVETSNKKGLNQFVSLYKYLSRLPVVIEETDKYFQIKIPLI